MNPQTLLVILALIFSVAGLVVQKYPLIPLAVILLAIAMLIGVA